MKKFSKLFLSCAAVAALTAAVATSAMAEEVPLTGNVTGTYYTDGENAGKLVIGKPNDIDAGTQATLLVYEAGADVTSVDFDEQVVGIDQAADAAFTKNGLKDKPQVPAEGNTQYTVKLGYYADGNFQVKTGTLTLGEVEGSEIKVGEVDGDGRVDSSDATCILYFDAGSSEVSEIGNVGKTITVSGGNTTKVGEVDGDGRVDSSDATCILYYDAGSVDTDEIGNVGTTITGTVE